MKLVDVVSILSPAERRVFTLAVGKGSSKDIANDLGLSMSAVHFHLGNIFRKLKVADRNELMSMFIDLDKPEKAWKQIVFQLAKELEDLKQEFSDYKEKNSLVGGRGN